MNSNHQDIVNFIESIYASRHLVAQAYCEGAVDIIDDNQKRLRELQQLRVMRPDVKSESLRLSSGMMKLFDQVLQRARSLSISSNFSEQMHRLSTLTEGFQTASHDGRLDDQEMYASDFDLAAYDISEEVEYMLLHVNTMAQNNFASTSSYVERVRQNDHYLAQMKKLVRTLSSLQDDVLMENLDSNFESKVLSQLYHHHILGRLSNWRSMLLNIISHLEQYLNKLRSVEPNAKRIRSFSMFLHQHPEYTPRDLDDYPEVPEWAYRHEGISIRAYPDIHDEDHIQDLAMIAKSIAGPAEQKTKKREAGVLVLDTEPLVTELKPTPFEHMVYGYFQEAKTSKTPRSAVEFFGQSEHLESSDIGLALMCFASLLEVPTRAMEMGANELEITAVIHADAGIYNGNVTVTDFLSCQKH